MIFNSTMLTNECILYFTCSFSITVFFKNSIDEEEVPITVIRKADVIYSVHPYCDHLPKK